jgi:sterol 3beta-glucosyltransferase
MKIALLAIGTQGDVQPFIALAQRLRQAGHQPMLIADRRYQAQAAELGLGFGPLQADFLQMMETKEGREAIAGKNLLSLYRKVIPLQRQLLHDAWAAAQDTEAIVYHPKALAGRHIAEKLGIPGYLSLPLPLYSPTREFAAPIIARDLGGTLNRLSFRLIMRAGALSYRKQINAWRRESLGLPPTGDESILHGRPVTRLYSYSRHVVPVPADWGAESIVTGYWFLQQPEYTPPADLERFLDEGDAPIYIGFGSMAGRDPAQTTRIVIEGVRESGRRAVLATGVGAIDPRDVPAGIHVLRSAPHDWLFPRMAAVAHHGGSGTTAAGLRAGKPTLICPFFGDQPFWGRRVADLGAGPQPIAQKRLTAARLAAAIDTLFTDTAMQARAAELGDKIRAEDGTGVAIRIIGGDAPETVAVTEAPIVAESSR